jgi:two-component system response regulator (stage 0 sporulation protein A)
VRRVLIVDHSEVFAHVVETACFADDQVKTCSDGNEAISLLSEFRPDLLILNLSLAHTDGFTILRQAQFLPQTVIVLSYLSDPFVLRIAGALGVRYVLQMPTPMGIRHALKEIETMAPGIRTDLRSAVLAHLHRLGIPTDMDGHQMLTLGLPLYLKDPGQTLSKELYPAIVCAMSRGTSLTVERSIRQAIQAAWKRRDERVWREYFSSNACGTISCPNNKKFLTALLVKLQQEYCES